MTRSQVQQATIGIQSSKSKTGRNDLKQASSQGNSVPEAVARRHITSGVPAAYGFKPAFACRLGRILLRKHSMPATISAVRLTRMRTNATLCKAEKRSFKH